MLFLSPLSLYANDAETEIVNGVHFVQALNKGSSDACFKPKKKFSSLSVDWKLFFAGQKCDQLLSLKPPAWISSNPKADLFKFPSNWGGLCSVARLKGITHEENNLSKDEQVEKLNALVRGSDLCANKEEDRYSSQYKLPSQNDRSLKVMDSKQKKEFATRYYQVKARSSKACCQGDARCSEVFDSVPAYFCVPNKDPNQPDRCIDNSHYLPDFDEQWWALGKKLGNTKQMQDVAIGRFELKPGSITLSPFLGEDSEEVMAHELGHACSQIKRKLAIFRGSEPNLGAYLNGGHCAIKDNTSKVYTDLTKALGADPKTSSCLISRSLDAKKLRYEKGTCENGCERASLEESYAIAFSLLSQPESSWVPLFIPKQICSGARDARHPLTSDVLRCLMDTPKIVKKLEEATRCQK